MCAGGGAVGAVGVRCVRATFEYCMFDIHSTYAQNNAIFDVFIQLAMHFCSGLETHIVIV